MGPFELRRLHSLPLVAAGAFALISTAFVTALAPTRAAAAQTFTTTDATPTDMVTEPPCVATEPIQFAGLVHQLIHTTINDDGTIHVQIENNFQAVTATGLITGAKYSTTDTTVFSSNIGLPPNETSAVQRTHYIRTGEVLGKLPDDFFADFHFHVTVNPGGQVTASVGSVDVECH
jgi:hypothetical protein